MATATGTVQIVTEKNGIYSLKLDDGAWYGFFKTKPKCAQGDMVVFDYVKKGTFTNADPDTLVVKKEVPAAGGAPKAGSDIRQDTISWQSARNAAIELVGIALQADAVKLPAKGDKLDVIIALVSDLTLRFNDESKMLKIKEMVNTPNPKFSEEE